MRSYNAHMRISTFRSQSRAGPATLCLQLSEHL
jgi:hypothetical protein